MLLCATPRSGGPLQLAATAFPSRRHLSIPSANSLGFRDKARKRADTQRTADHVATYSCRNMQGNLQLQRSTEGQPTRPVWPYALHFSVAFCKFDGQHLTHFRTFISFRVPRISFHPIKIRLPLPHSISFILKLFWIQIAQSTSLQKNEVTY
jgi:hypothetical protein